MPKKRVGIDRHVLLCSCKWSKKGKMLTLQIITEMQMVVVFSVRGN